MNIPQPSNNGNEIEVLSCDICNYTTDDKLGLVEHVAKHSLRQLFSCDRCCFMAEHRAALSEHTATAHSEPVKRFSCKVCSYTTANKWNLKEHAEVHVYTRPYQCSVCGFKTSFKWALRQHRLGAHPDGARNKVTPAAPAAADPRPMFECDSCDFRTSFLWAMNQHKWLHPSSRPYTCHHRARLQACRSYERYARFCPRKMISIETFVCKGCGHKTCNMADIKRHVLSHSVIRISA